MSKQASKQGSKQASSLWAAAAFSLVAALGVACGGDHVPEYGTNLGTAAQAVGVVPNESECSYGVGKNKCLRMERIDPQSASAVDGVQGANEYALSTEVGFTNLGEGAPARLFLTVDRKANQFRVFAKNLPLRPGSSKVAVFLDFNRFEPLSQYVGAGDFGFQLDVDANVLTTLAPVATTPSTTRWASTTGGPGWTAASANVRFDSTGRRSVDVEFRIGISGFITDSAFGFSLATSVAPGVGHVQPSGFGMFPEDLGVLGELASWDRAGTPLAKRENYQTLVLKSPPGNALTFMTWNVKRFTPLMQTLEDLSPASALDTSGIPDSDIGKFIGAQGADVVGLQEVWSAASATGILTAANRERASRGLPPYDIVGSTDFAPNILGELPGNVSLRPDETSGGIYILSARRVLQTGYQVYSACKGEDCFKAKGAVWARLSTDDFAAPGACAATGQPCPPPPSGDHYVDVFVTHFQGTNPQACTVSAVSTALAAAYVSIPGLFFSHLLSDNFNCLQSDTGVQYQQLSELGKFVDSIVDSGRQSVILGDFNINGAQLSDPGYALLLSRLNIAPATPSGSNPSPDEVLNPWPSALQTDLDHGDVARDTISDWSAGNGTDIGESNYNGPRLDYVLVRNPVDRSQLKQSNLHYIFRKVANQRVWASPWPGPADQTSRLSDHKPVISSLEVGPYYTPGAYHSGFAQDIEFRVVGYDTTGLDDCWGCDELDMYGKMTGARFQPGLTGFTTFQTAECKNRWSSIFGVDGCMDGWWWSDFRPVTVPTHRGTLELWDHDVAISAPDDQYDFADETSQPVFDFDWSRGALDLKEIRTPAVTYPDWMKFYDNAPVTRRTRATRANVSLRVKLTEHTPYP